MTKKKKVIQFELSDWKEAVLNQCFTGIDKIDSFCKTEPGFYFIAIEEIKESFKNIVKLLR